MVKRSTVLGVLIVLIAFGLSAQKKDVSIEWIDPSSNNAVVTDDPFYLEFKIYTKEKGLLFYISKETRKIRAYAIQKNDTTYSVIEQVKLEDGENKLAIVYKIDDDVYLIDSLTLTKEDKKQESAGGVMSSNFSRSDYAIIISNRDYDNWPQLNNQGKLTRAIAEELELSYGFRVQYMENVDHYSFLADFLNIIDYGCNSTDQLLVFIEGHGTIDRGSNYIVLADSPALSDRAETWSMISYNSLVRMVEMKNCSNVLLILDVLKASDSRVFESTPKVAGMGLDGEALKRFSLGVPTKRYLTNTYRTYEESQTVNHKKELSSVILEALRTYGGNDGILTLEEIKEVAKTSDVKLNYGTFSSEDDPKGDFVFIAR